MGYGFTLDDVAFLRSDAGSAALAEADALPLTDATRIADVAAVRRSVGEEHAAAVLEQVLEQQEFLGRELDFLLVVRDRGRPGRTHKVAAP